MTLRAQLFMSRKFCKWVSYVRWWKGRVYEPHDRSGLTRIWNSCPAPCPEYDVAGYPIRWYFVAVVLFVQWLQTASPGEVSVVVMKWGDKAD